METSFLTAAQLIDIAILLLGREEEILQELSGRQTGTITHLDIFSNVSDNVDDLLLIVKLEALLTVVAETDRLAHIKLTLIGFHLAEQHLEESTLARTVRPHNAQFLIAGKGVVIVLEDDAPRVSLPSGWEGLRDMFGLKNLIADIGRFHLETERLLLMAALGSLLQFIESLNA